MRVLAKAHIYITHRHRRQWGDSLRENRARAGWRWAKGEKMRTSVIVSTIKSKVKKRNTLAGMAQWIECWPANQRVAGLIPTQGKCLGCGPGSQLEA